MDDTAVVDAVHFRVSVVVPILNARTTVGELLESLLRQTVSNFEVVIADNGSSDGTQDEVKRYGERLNHLVTVDASQTRGPGYARRVGAEAANGDFLLFIDADDTVNETYIEAMTNALQGHTFVHAATDMIRHNPSWLYTRELGFGTATPDVGGWKWALGGTIGVRRSAYDRCGGWAAENGLADDSDFCWRMRHAGHNLQCVPEAIVYRRGRHSSAGAWKQGRWYGRHQATSNRMWRSEGVPVESEWTLVARAWSLARTLPALRMRRERGFWLKEAGVVTARAQYDLLGLVPFGPGPRRHVLDVPAPSSDPTMDRFRNVGASAPR